MIISLVIGILLGVTTVIFALQNMAPVSVVFLSWTFEGSMALILILTMVAGVIIAVLMSLPDFIKKSFRISNLKSQNKILKEDLASKGVEVETGRAKLDANNAYIDGLERNPKI